ncbi:MAG: family 78 glycoside hydrolase catalytic domain [Chitinophagaceae bacterium]|nr:family 78 glycoside hydrolase catalytic domain [Chitinophagaceae bacterium]
MKYRVLFARFFPAVIVAMISCAGYAQLDVAAALCDNRENPTGIHVRDLFFSWELTSSQNGQRQTAYQVVLASSEKLLAAQQYDVYNSGQVRGSESIQVLYKGKTLLPARTYYWQVRVWDAYGKASAWSRPQRFITGIFTAAEWKQARWIGMEDAPASARIVPFVHGKLKENDRRMLRNPVAPLLRKSFPVSKKITSALLFITGLGHYEASLNGEKVGNAFLAPGWTDYDQTVLYNTYDITGKIKTGENVIGVLLGNGFYHVSQERYVKGTGSFGLPKMIAQLRIAYEDGSEEYIVSDPTWKTKASPVVFNNIYGGEDFDARLIQQGWNKPGYNDADWKPVLLTAIPRGKLLPEIDYPVTIADSLSVKSVKKPDNNILVYDFGQNVSGIPKIKLKGRPGQTVKLIPAELVFTDGKVNQADGVSPHYYQYTIGSYQEETWQPSFTYFAARYVQVEGAVQADDTKNVANKPVITGIKLMHNRNSAPSNGSFVCSDSLFNRIYTLIDRAVKSNIQSYITDNPQREKLSWQGEQNFMRTAINYNYNMYGMYRSLVQNMMDAQHANGLVPDIAPEYMQFEGPFVDSPEWGTTAILDMWFLYTFYGDTMIIRKAYPMMKRYAQYLESRSQDHLLLYGLGDWLDIGNVTPKGITATAYYFKAITALSQMAALTGKQADAEYYKKLSVDIRQAFNKKYFNDERKVYATGSQTAMAMPLSLGMVDEKNKEAVLTNLVHQIKNVDSNRLTAGDVGHKFLVRALYENGHSRVLYDITRRADAPGYAYQLNLGATALIETWDGKASQNQLAMGHILEWFHEGIAGIRQDSNSVAFKNIVIRPQVVGDMHAAGGSFHSPYGWIKSNWKLERQGFTIDIEIPVNTRAKVILPAANGARVLQNGKPVKDIMYQNNTAIMHVQPGTYSITVAAGAYR